MTALKLSIEFAQSHELPSSFVETATQFYYPVAVDIFKQVSAAKTPVFLGINGCQGSGKSTLTDYLLFVFTTHFGLPSVGLSIDDFYLTQGQRKNLADQVHPLFVTRGVPGTHDVELLQQTVRQLTQWTSSVKIPRFNKATDDRIEPEKWTLVNQPPKLIILEGWCVGVTAQDTEELRAPVNSLERLEDADSVWRRFVNQALLNQYESLFQQLDRLLFLQAPGFHAVKAWRLQQEDKLRKKMMAQGRAMSGVMDEQQIERFIQHYQRITEQSLKILPKLADDVFTLDEHRRVKNFSSKGVNTK